MVSEGISADQVCAFMVDVSKVASIREGAIIARQAFGPVTMLINNAGVVSGKSTEELTEEQIERTFRVNTISHLYTIKEFLPDMKAEKRGHIVTVASMAGIAGVPGLTDYCASKWGAVGLDEALRLELKSAGLYH